MNKKKIFLTLGLVVAVAAGALAFGGNSNLFKGSVSFSAGSAFSLAEEVEEVAEGETESIIFNIDREFPEGANALVYRTMTRAENQVDFATDIDLEINTESNDGGDFRRTGSKYSFIRINSDDETLKVNVSALADDIEEGDEIFAFGVYVHNGTRWEKQLNYTLDIVEGSTEETPVTCFELRSSYDNDEISASTILNDRAEICAENFPAVWYEDNTANTDESCAIFREYHDEGIVSRSGIGRLHQIASFCSTEHKIGWNGLPETPEEETPVTCYFLRNNYTVSEISRYSVLNERAETCAETFDYAWYGSIPDTGDECFEFREFWEDGTISRSGISRFTSVIAPYCHRTYWSEEDYFESSADLEELFGDTPVVTTILSLGGSDLEDSIRLTVEDEIMSVTITEVRVDDADEITVELLASNSSYEESYRLTAGEGFDLYSTDSSEEMYEVYVTRILGTESGVGAAALSIVPVY
jgi:hypothetical protein